MLQPSSRQAASTPQPPQRYSWCFRLRPRRAAALMVVLESDAAGDFSEAFHLLLPLQPPGRAPPPPPPPLQPAPPAPEGAATAEPSLLERAATAANTEAGQEGGGGREPTEEGTAGPGRGHGRGRAGVGGPAPPPRVCFYTDVVFESAEAFRSAVRVMELHGMQTF